MLCIIPINILGPTAYVKPTAAVQNVAPRSNFRSHNTLWNGLFL